MFSLKMKTGNAAFKEDTGYEIARILGGVRKKLEDGGVSGTLIDYNGNVIGSWELI